MLPSHITRLGRMARWEPHARERLIQATVDLFSEQGYDRTTVNEIAARAGLTKTTFFRHFPDKREVLFAGQETIGSLLAEGVAAAPAGATPLEAVAAGLDLATGSFQPMQRAWGPRIEAVVAAHPELRERASFKHASFAAAIRDALHARGVPEPAAFLAAELGVGAFTRGWNRWIEPATEDTYPALAREALRELRETAAALR